MHCNIRFQFFLIMEPHPIYRSCSHQLARSRGGVGGFHSKVPGDVPSARVYFFKLSSLAKGILFANFSPFSLGKGMIFGNFSRFYSWQGYGF